MEVCRAAHGRSREGPAMAALSDATQDIIGGWVILMSLIARLTASSGTDLFDTVEAIDQGETSSTPPPPSLALSQLPIPRFYSGPSDDVVYATRSCHFDHFPRLIYPRVDPVNNNWLAAGQRIQQLILRLRERLLTYRLTCSGTVESEGFQT